LKYAAANMTAYKMEENNQKG